MRSQSERPRVLLIAGVSSAVLIGTLLIAKWCGIDYSAEMNTEATIAVRGAEAPVTSPSPSQEPHMAGWKPLASILFNANYPLPNAGAVTSTAIAANDEPFLSVSYHSPEGPMWEKWRKVQAGIRSEQDVLSRCLKVDAICPVAASRLLAVINDARGHEKLDELGLVNRAINLSITATNDMTQFGVPDVWSTPLATLTSGRGDCEDYAFAKYEALHQVGWPLNDLRLVVVWAGQLRKGHMVLAARLDKRWLILDERTLMLLVDVDQRNYTALFVLDHRGVRQFNRPWLPGSSDIAVSAGDEIGRRWRGC